MFCSTKVSEYPLLPLVNDALLGTAWIFWGMQQCDTDLLAGDGTTHCGLSGVTDGVVDGDSADGSVLLVVDWTEGDGDDEGSSGVLDVPSLLSSLAGVSGSAGAFFSGAGWASFSDSALVVLHGRALSEAAWRCTAWSS